METIALVKDPVCGMDVTPENAAGSSDYGGRTYDFCSAACRSRFEHDPSAYVDPPPAPSPATAPGAGATNPFQRISLPVTGMNCGACAARLEKALSHASGVRGASVNFAASSAAV